MPSSASWPISVTLSISASPDGPTSIPATRKPGTAPKPAARNSGTVTTAAVSRITMSRR